MSKLTLRGAAILFGMSTSLPLDLSSNEDKAEAEKLCQDGFVEIVKDPSSKTFFISGYTLDPQIADLKRVPVRTGLKLTVDGLQKVRVMQNMVVSSGMLDVGERLSV